VSQTAKEFVTMCLTVDPTQRPTASEVLKHRWLADEKPHYVPDPGSLTGGPTNLLPHIQKRLDARARCECPVLLFLNTLSRSRDIYVQSAVPYGVLPQ
jgi:serine/threonine protein kinase